MEEKYWELREKWDRAKDAYAGAPTAKNLQKVIHAEYIFKKFCAEVLEKLMEENSDVLERLRA